MYGGSRKYRRDVGKGVRGVVMWFVKYFGVYIIFSI